MANIGLKNGLYKKNSNKTRYVMEKTENGYYWRTNINTCYTGRENMAWIHKSLWTLIASSVTKTRRSISSKNAENVLSEQK